MNKEILKQPHPDRIKDAQWKNKTKKTAKKSFEKSQEDIKAGRVNTYKSVDEMVKKF